MKQYSIICTIETKSRLGVCKKYLKGQDDILERGSAKRYAIQRRNVRGRLLKSVSEEIFMEEE